MDWPYIPTMARYQATTGQGINLNNPTGRPKVLHIAQSHEAR